MENPASNVAKNLAPYMRMAYTNASAEVKDQEIHVKVGEEEFDVQIKNYKRTFSSLCISNMPAMLTNYLNQCRPHRANYTAETYHDNFTLQMLLLYHLNAALYAPGKYQYIIFLDLKQSTIDKFKDFIPPRFTMLAGYGPEYYFICYNVNNDPDLEYQKPTNVVSLCLNKELYKRMSPGRRNATKSLISEFIRVRYPDRQTLIEELVTPMYDSELPLAKMVNLVCSVAKFDRKEFDDFFKLGDVIPKLVFPIANKQVKIDIPISEPLRSLWKISMMYELDVQQYERLKKVLELPMPGGFEDIKQLAWQIKQNAPTGWELIQQSRLAEQTPN